jgi:RNA polymerase sigma factor (sigma-70 family)
MDHLSAARAEGSVGSPAEATATSVEDASASFEDFFGRERDRLFGLLVLVTADRHEAEELAQEALVIVWERWDRVRAMDNPAGYLHRTAMNAFRKRYRRAKILRRVSSLAASPPDEAAADAALVLDETLRGLTSRQRAALVLTELLGYSASEAASALGVKASTIGALKYQARTAIKRDSESADD